MKSPDDKLVEKQLPLIDTEPKKWISPKDATYLKLIEEIKKFQDAERVAKELLEQLEDQDAEV